MDIRYFPRPLTSCQKETRMASVTKGSCHPDMTHRGKPRLYGTVLSARLVQRNHEISAAMIAFAVGEEDHLPWPRVDGFLVAMRALNRMPIKS
jgi:hypothetical protein